MKKLSPLFVSLLLITNLIIAQVPQAMNYQGVARNALGVALQNQLVGMQFSIRDGSPTGSIIYQETDTATTNQFGLFATYIGKGTAAIGTFSGITWSTGDKYLEVALDATGGNSYATMGTTQLLSVPYALYAKSAGTVSTGGGFTHYVGELFGGGVVFYVYKDANGQEHGLVVSLNNQGGSVNWSNIDTSTVGEGAQSSWDGASNTNAIIAQAGHTSSAALTCKNYTGGGFTDWYLPAIDELKLLFSNRFNVNKTIGNTGTPINYDSYWSSSEDSYYGAWAFGLGGYPSADDNRIGKGGGSKVRAIRAF